MEQDYNTMVKKFLAELEASITWSKELKNPKWDNSYRLPKLGKRTAKHYLDN